jgi:hypothetical protein
MKDLFYLIIGWSITSILVNGSIFDPLRIYLLVKKPILHKLFSCMQCSGFWVGVVIGLLSVSGLIYHPLDSLFDIENIWISPAITVIGYGFLNSGISVLINSLVVFFFSFDRNS